jgi:hypothetical protein
MQQQRNNSRGEPIVNWDTYLAWSIHGEPAIYSTLHRFQDHLSHYMHLERTAGYTSGQELPHMGNVDWDAIVRDEEFQNKKGDFDPKLAIAWFTKELTDKATELMKAAAAAKLRAASRVQTIHKVFDDYGEDKIAEALLVQAVLIAMQVPIREMKEEQEIVVNYLHDSKHKDFASLVAGPNSGVVRVLLPTGKPTKFYTEMSAKEKEALYYHEDHNEGAPTRGPKS